MSETIDFNRIVAQTTTAVVEGTIDIPRILVFPKGEVTSGFDPFILDTKAIHYQPVERDILIQHLRTNERKTLTLSSGGMQEKRLEDYLVRGLIDFNDISYDDHSDLLYDLATQMVSHLRSYLMDEESVRVSQRSSNAHSPRLPRIPFGTFATRSSKNPEFPSSFLAASSGVFIPYKNFNRTRNVSLRLSLTENHGNGLSQPWVSSRSSTSRV